MTIRKETAMLKNKEIYSIEKELDWLQDKNIYKDLKRIGMHNGQPAILAYIYMHQNCTQYEIAKYLGLSRASIGVSIKRMAASGYLEVQPSQIDKRSTELTITKEGIKTLVKSDMIIDDYISKKYAGFNETELTNYIKYLNKIKKNLTKIYRDNRSDK